jgi:hypothetical protein
MDRVMAARIEKKAGWQTSCSLEVSVDSGSLRGHHLSD